MKKITIMCDRCKKVVTDVRLVAAGIAQEKPNLVYGGHTSIATPFKAEWCLECCKAVGFTDHKEPAKEVVQEKLEGIVREIIKEEIEKSKQSGRG